MNITREYWYDSYRRVRMLNLSRGDGLIENYVLQALYARDQDPIKFIQSPRLRMLIKKNYTRYIFKEVQKANQRLLVTLNSVYGRTNKILEDMPFIEAPHIDEKPR